MGSEAQTPVLARPLVSQNQTSALPIFPTTDISAIPRGVLSFLVNNKALTIFGILFVYNFIRSVYRLYFHPLSKFPGPNIAAISDIWFGYVHITGQSIWIMKALHEKYGPVVRIAPNDLSFSTPTSYRDINKSKVPFPKTEFFDAIDNGFNEAGIGTERDVEKHLRKRKFLTPAFTPAATKMYEPLVAPHLDSFLKEIEERGKLPEGVDFVEWYQFLTFDTAGDLAFGESFKALSMGVQHRWMSLVTESIDIAAYFEAARRFPVFLAIFQKFIPAKITEARKWHVDWSKQQTYYRIANPSSRGDMLGFMVDSEGKTSISHDELTAHASQLILGGAETMTGMLVGTTYFLAKTPRVQQLLQKEIREAFESVDDITAAKLSTMKYLTAVIHEGLRSFPPGPTGLPRYSPGALVDGHFVPKGTKVSTHPWTVTHSEEYWDKPDEFRPERWLEEGNKDVKDASVPFGLGTRQCLGQNIAWMEMRLYLAKMMWLYNLELVDKERDWVKDCKTYFMWMKAPLMIKVERREGF